MDPTSFTTILDIFEKLGVLDKVYHRLFNNPGNAAKQLDQILTYLEVAFVTIEDVTAEMCTLSFAQKDLNHTRKVLIGKESGLLQELSTVSVHCKDIKHIYRTNLSGIFTTLTMSEGERSDLKELFDRLTEADWRFNEAVDTMDTQFKLFISQVLDHLDQDEVQKATNLSKQLRKELAPTRKELAGKLKELRILQAKFHEETTNPCVAPPVWPMAPLPGTQPLKTMSWATGTKKDQFGCSRDGGAKFHAGIDIKAPVGTSCFAIEDAVVEAVGYGSEVGKYVTLSFRKGGQKYGAAYCHLSKIAVDAGVVVKAGDKLGETGITGNAEASNPHLHLEIQDQVWVAYANSGDRSEHGINPNNYITNV